MKILCTGATGFVGSHLVEALLSSGHEVRAMAHYRSSPDLGNLYAACEVVRGDIRDGPFVSNAAKGMDVVFHLAALVDVPYSYEAPQSYLETNLMGTFNVLQACLHRYTPLVHTSTSEVYGTAEYTPMDERHPVNPQSPYAASKAAADALVRSYCLSYQLPAIIIRPFNTFGPRQSERGVVAHIIQEFMRSNVIHIGDVKPKRDYTFVSDTVAGFVHAIDHWNTSCPVYNLGTGEAYSVRDIINMVANIQEIEEFDVEEVKDRMRPPASEVKVLQSDNRKARKELGWKPHVDIINGLDRTIQWFIHKRKND
jgi:nucleoside-diphosphate-sugar epimerase